MAIERPCDRCGHLMEDVGLEDPRARTTEHVQPPDPRRRFRCPACGAEEIVTETAPESEVESWEKGTRAEVRGGKTKARGKDRRDGGVDPQPWAAILIVLATASSRTALKSENW